MSVQLHIVLVICIVVSGSREESQSPVRVRGGNLSGAEGTCRYVTGLGTKQICNVLYDWLKK